MLPQTTTIQRHDILIPSLNKKVKFRPFLVKEEKVLLIALESGQDTDLIDACRQIVTNCCQEQINVSNLTTFDLEYIFLKIAAISSSNISKLAYIDNEDNKRYDIELNLDEVESPVIDNDNRIKVNDSITIVMRYPTVGMAEEIAESETEMEMLDRLVLHCIDCIYEGDSVHENIDREELAEWVDQLDTATFDKIREFFDNIPQLHHVIKYTNSKGSEREVVLTTLADFFMW